MNRSLEKVDSSFMNDFQEFDTSVKEVITDVVEAARQIEVELEDVTGSLQSHDKTLMDEELLFMDEQTKQFLEIESTPGEDAIKTIEMTTKDLKYHINLGDKTAADFERTDFNSEVLRAKCYQTELHITEKLFSKGTSD